MEHDLQPDLGLGDDQSNYSPSDSETRSGVEDEGDASSYGSASPSRAGDLSDSDCEKTDTVPGHPQPGTQSPSPVTAAGDGEIPKDAGSAGGSSLFKLESLVQNILQQHSPNVPQPSTPPRQAPVMVRKRTPAKPVKPVATLAKDAPRGKIPDSMIPLPPGSMPLGLVPPGLPLPVFPQMAPGMAFPPPMCPTLPLLPFGFPPGLQPLGLPPLPETGVPAVSSASVASEIKEEDGPLDLTSARKRKLSYSEGGDREKAVNLVKTEGCGSVSGNHGNGKPLKVHIPASVKGQVHASSAVPSPRPSILSHSPGSSAFSTYSPSATSCGVPVKSEPGSRLDPLAFPTKEHVECEHRMLEADFQEVLPRLEPGSTISQLLESYYQDVERVEEKRQAMLNNPDPQATECVQNMTEAFCDQQRLLLARQVKLLLIQDRLRLGFLGSPPQHLSSGPLTSPFPLSRRSAPTPTRHPFVPSTDPEQQDPSLLVPVASSGDVTPVMPVLPKDSSSDSAGDSSSPRGGDKSRGGSRRKFLDQHAINILTAWYDSHQDHPYPDDATVEFLAQTANLAVSQVKKWMANKRVRTCNTLAFNGSIHPRKLAKIMQMKDSSSPKEIQESPVGQPAGIQDISPQTPFSTVSSSSKRSKRLLDPHAVDTLNRWYREHIEYPYPTEEEKQQLSQQAGLALAQVTCWFANKRNRSNNTRKSSNKNLWSKMGQVLPFPGAKLDLASGHVTDIPVSMVPRLPLPGFPQPGLTDFTAWHRPTEEAKQ